ncbi:MAG: GNAT family N-acetyltransferase [bacterium]|nr:GNAT family N-acetyltransferase [bacterium]
MNIRAMDKDFVLFRCVHWGPLSPSNIETAPANIPGLLEGQFERNRRFLTRVIDAYGSCGMLAMDREFVVGHVRFYPQAICDQHRFCCQDPNNAIKQEMVEMNLPKIENPAKRILRIDCILVHEDYRGRGLSHALLDGVLEWAREHNWTAVRAWASPDNYWLASQICAPMLRTYLKHGFEKAETAPSSEIRDLIRDLLTKIRDGEMGAEKKKEFQQFCGGQDLSEIATYYEVERQL